MQSSSESSQKILKTGVFAARNFANWKAFVAVIAAACVMENVLKLLVDKESRNLLIFGAEVKSFTD